MAAVSLFVLSSSSASSISSHRRRSSSFFGGAPVPRQPVTPSPLPRRFANLRPIARVAATDAFLEEEEPKNKGTFPNAFPPRNKFLGEDYLVRKVSAEELETLVKSSERTVPLIVDFYATWCGPCILMAQELEMLAVEYEDNALFVKIDTDDEYEFARDMQVRGLPTLYFFSPNPKDAIRAEGLVPKQMIQDIIDNQM